MTERKRKKAPSSADYDIGYGKPPIQHQFEKGQPRPPRKVKPNKPELMFEDYLAEELQEPMRIVENGVEQYIPKGKALAKASISGAISDRDPRRLKGFLPQPRAVEDFDFSEIDLGIVARFLALLQKQQAQRSSKDAAEDEDTDKDADADGEAPE